MGLGIKTHILIRVRTAYENLFSPRQGRFLGHYDEWRAKRLSAILAKYGPNFWLGKTLLELGAGLGDIGAFFALLGAKVTCYEGRADNVKWIRRRFEGVLHSQTVDCDGPLPGTDEWQVIIHFGLLYHLENPEASLRSCCSRCEHLILETECSDSDDPNYIEMVKEKAFLYDQALGGTGCRPSPAWVERILIEEGFSFETIADDRCNSSIHHYDWQVKNTKAAPSGQRRMWFAKRK